MRTALITGVSRGIGRGVALKFLDEGWFVIGSSTNGKIQIEHEHLYPLRLDYLDTTSIDMAVREIKGLVQGIDVLVNNAGFGELENCNQVNLQLLRKTFEVNFFGTIEFTEKLLSKMNSPSEIINISSRSASLTSPRENPYFIPSYRMSKTALNMYTCSVAEQYKKHGITISSIDPGRVNTGMGIGQAIKTSEQAAEEIFNLALLNKSTGLFWSNLKPRPW